MTPPVGRDFSRDASDVDLNLHGTNEVCIVSHVTCGGTMYKEWDWNEG
jgi:hypothetical protein